MSISLKNFVDINIKTNVSPSVVSTRDTVLLYTSEGTTGTSLEIDSYDEAVTLLDSETFVNTLDYLKIYFDNGGIKIKLEEGIADFSEIPAYPAIDNKYICIAYCDVPANIETNFAGLKAIAEASESIYGIDEKILLARTTSKLEDTDTVKNFAVKYSTIHGAEMTIAAYLCRINVYSSDSVHDYMYTAEKLTKETISNSDYTQLIANNYNFDIDLANAVRNCGGNMKNGEDLVNGYVLIILQQTLTDVLLNALTQKLKNMKGVAYLNTVICNELNKYVDCGYLSQDSVWSSATLTTTYNGTEYTIIEKGQSLQNGYVVKVLPYSALTDADKIAHKTPPIHVVLATQYGIRKITVEGEVI